jgi:SNF2 family DNA or RNA helicase
VTASGKFKVLDSMLRHLHAGGHQVLVFSQMTETLNIMEDYLRFREWRYCRIDGNVKVQERQSQMDAFNNDADIFVFMLSTRAGGLGINLQAADTVILFDSDWNPHQDAQVSYYEKEGEFIQFFFFSKVKSSFNWQLILPYSK